MRSIFFFNASNNTEKGPFPCQIDACTYFTFVEMWKLYQSAPAMLNVELPAISARRRRQEKRFQHLRIVFASRVMTSPDTDSCVRLSVGQFAHPARHRREKETNSYQFHDAVSFRCRIGACWPFAWLKQHTAQKYTTKIMHYKNRLLIKQRIFLFILCFVNKT